MGKESIHHYRISKDTLRRGGGEDRHLQYVESWLRPQDSHLISVQINEAMNLKPKLLGLLGYSMRQPFLGYVDGQDPMNQRNETQMKPIFRWKA